MSKLAKSRPPPETAWAGLAATRASAAAVDAIHLVVVISMVVNDDNDNGEGREDKDLS